MEKEEASIEYGMCGSGAKGNDIGVGGEGGHNGSEIGGEIAIELGDIKCDVARG